MKQTEGKLEDDKKALKMMLEDAENRCTKLELARRSLEGDLQRLKLVLTDKETENQVSPATGVENVCYILGTVNVVIFAGGKFHENVVKIFHVGVIFTIFHIFL